MQKKLFLITMLIFCASIHADSPLGKTHFILGFTPETAEIRLKRILNIDIDGGVILRVLFSPDEDVRQALIDLIESEKESIKLAVYYLTDKEVAQALIRAHRRGVTVVCIVDEQCARSRYGKVRFLRRYKVPVITHCSTRENRYQRSLMHHKFVLFGKNISGRSLVWTGSFNFTYAARMRNQENAVIADNAYLFNRFARQFEKLQSRVNGTEKKAKKNRRFYVRRFSRGVKKALRALGKNSTQKS